MKKISLILSFFVLVSALHFVMAKPNTWQNIDSAALAHAEVKLWQAYYAQDFPGLFVASLDLLREQFKLSYVDALIVAGFASDSAAQFARLPLKTTMQQYEKAVLPSLERLYAYLAWRLDRNWPSLSLAQAELAWWVARRDPRQNSPQQVGAKIAKLYTLVYGYEDPHLLRAGLLRAQAAALRDRQQRQGQVDWQAVESLLQQSYQALREACDIHAGYC